jgi:hypothetical protein
MAKPRCSAYLREFGLCVKHDFIRRNYEVFKLPFNLIELFLKFGLEFVETRSSGELPPKKMCRCQEIKECAAARTSVAVAWTSTLRFIAALRDSTSFLSSSIFAPCKVKRFCEAK